MPKQPAFTGYSLEGRLLVWVLAIYVSGLSVVLLLIPIINHELEIFNNYSMFYIEGAKEAEADNYARDTVLDLARQKDLLEVKAGPATAADQPIIDLMWENITFNLAIDGMELIQGQKNAEGERVTFRFYRRPVGKEPMRGPEKILKRFSGLEAELIEGIDRWEQVDLKLLNTINLGPKEEGEMLLRYLPVHVLLPRRGAIYWGVAKIGVDTNWARIAVAKLRDQKNELSRVFRVYVILILIVSAMLSMILMFFFPWVRRLTKPLNKLAAVTRDLNDVHHPEEYALWVESLKRFNPQGQTEVGGIQQVLLRLGVSIRKLGQRLATAEGQACLGKVMGRWALQNSSAQLQTLDEGQPPEPVQKEKRELLNELQVEVRDLLRFLPAGTGGWQRLDLTSRLRSIWHLVISGLPAETQVSLDIKPLPLVWGSPVDLPLAVLYLLDIIVDRLDPGGQVGLKAAPTPAGGVQMVLEVSGCRLTAAEWQDWLTLWPGSGEIQEELRPALATAIVSQHGGTLTVQSKEKDRVIFSLELPPLVMEDEPLESNN